MILSSALLSYGSAPSSALKAHILLAGVQTGPLAFLADAALVASIAWYLVSVRRLRARGHRWSTGATAAFLAGWVVVWIAVGSGLAAYDDVNVTLHVAQHLLLMMVAPPLLALGKPVTLAIQVSRRANQLRIVRVVNHPLVAAVTFPVVAWLIYYGVMYTYFLSGVYDYSISHQLFHDATHLTFLVVGYLYWQPMIGADPSRWRLGYPTRVLSLFVGMPFEVFLGISITFMTRPIDPINTLANTRAGGYLFWIGSMTITSAVLAVILLRWYRKIERDTPREDRRAQAEAVESRARAEALGVTGLREGWTVPWWQLAQLESREAGRHGAAASSEEPPAAR